MMMDDMDTEGDEEETPTAEPTPAVPEEAPAEGDDTAEEAGTM
jgi:hypothetical protein